MSYGGQEAVRAGVAQLVEHPEPLSLSALVWFEPANEVLGDKGKFLYFFLGTGLCKFFTAVRNGEIDAIDGFSILDRKGAGAIIKRGLKLVCDITDMPSYIIGDCSREPSLDDFVAGLRVGLFKDRIGICGLKGNESRFQIADVTIGPFNH
jgi:hypothetical protein